MDDRHDVLREFIDLYVCRERIERIVFLWESKPKRRAQLYHELIRDAYWFRDERCTDIKPPIDDPAQILERMRNVGAGKKCLIYGEYDYDEPAHEADWGTAITEYLAGPQYAVMMYCPKSKSAFVQGHNGEQMLLHVKPSAK